MQKTYLQRLQSYLTNQRPIAWLVLACVVFLGAAEVISVTLKLGSQFDRVASHFGWNDPKFDPLRFEVDSTSVLISSSEAKLGEYATILKDLDAEKIYVDGHHFDNEPAANTDIAQRRAYYVANKLVSMGVVSSRLIVRSFGAEQLLPGRSPSSFYHARVQISLEE